MCVYLSLYISLSLSIYIYIYTCVYIYIYICVYVCIYITLSYRASKIDARCAIAYCSLRRANFMYCYIILSAMPTSMLTNILL